MLRDSSDDAANTPLAEFIEDLQDPSNCDICTDDVPPSLVDEFAGRQNMSYKIIRTPEGKEIGILYYGRNENQEGA